MKIKIEAVVNAGIEKVWNGWNSPESIPMWAFADPSWEAPWAKNDLQTGGKFTTRMQAKDGSAGFEFSGVYTEVIPNQKIVYKMDDGRECIVTFKEVDGGVKITEEFDPENENPEEMQRAGWQSILDNFKKYIENN